MHSKHCRKRRILSWYQWIYNLYIIFMSLGVSEVIYNCYIIFVIWDMWNYIQVTLVLCHLNQCYHYSMSKHINSLLHMSNRMVLEMPDSTLRLHGWCWYSNCCFLYGSVVRVFILHQGASFILVCCLHQAGQRKLWLCIHWGKILMNFE